MEDKEIIKKVIKEIHFREDNIDVNAGIRDGHDDNYHYIEDYCFKGDVEKAIKETIKLVRKIKLEVQKR
ncbi:hypothetical protein LCGC14_2567780 [marine sediment metagenome]|uniref:Uncharacterized protein n=1 Tax=marine sediment metagenome TaxID=412755 RepID=A0A0F9B632_9ZZZZ